MEKQKNSRIVITLTMGQWSFVLGGTLAVIEAVFATFGAIVFFGGAK